MSAFWNETSFCNWSFHLKLSSVNFDVRATEEMKNWKRNGPISTVEYWIKIETHPFNIQPINRMLKFHGLSTWYCELWMEIRPYIAVKWQLNEVNVNNGSRSCAFHSHQYHGISDFTESSCVWMKYILIQVCVRELSTCLILFKNTDSTHLSHRSHSWVFRSLSTGHSRSCQCIWMWDDTQINIATEWKIWFVFHANK